MTWHAAPEVDDDLIAARDFIAADNPTAARDFLDAAFEAFDKLAQFPQMGPQAHFKHPALKPCVSLYCHRPSTAGSSSISHHHRASR